jgi:adenine deaminase
VKEMLSDLGEEDMDIEKLVRAAKGEVPCDLLIKGTRLVNVNTGEVQEGTNVAVAGERIAYIGEEELPAIEVFDAAGRYAIPGLIDTHVHIESSQVTPPMFAESVLVRGTTTIAFDPHEIGNVLGKEGVKLMVEATRGLPLKAFWMVPSCVPSAEGVETAGAEFFAEDVAEMLGWERAVGVAEIMDYYGVTNLRQRMVEIIGEGRKRGVVLDGHCVDLKGRELNAYVATGIEACHENFFAEQVLAKLRAGMEYVKVRNIELMSYFVPPERREAYMKAFVDGLNLVPDKRGILFCTDDIMPDVLLEHGHLDGVLRAAIEHGYDPIKAIQGATISCAAHLRLHDLGAVAPGCFADVLLLDDLKRFEVTAVFANGRLVAKHGRLLDRIPAWEFPEFAKKTVKLVEPREEDFLIRAPIREGKVKVRAMDLSTVFSGFVVREAEVKDGFVQPGGLTTVAVFERHGRNGNRNLALAQNGLERGAIASTIGHDSHNLSVMGRSPGDMKLAAKALLDAQGGVSVVCDGELRALLPLPVAGLMSEERTEVVAEGMRKVRRELRKLGRDEPWFLTIWTISIPVGPGGRVTDRCLIDGNLQREVSLFVE